MTKRKRAIRHKQERIKNKKLVKKYPWLAPKNVWTGQIPSNYDYSFINWGCSEGWDKAFGKMYMEELGDAIEKAGMRNTFQILQIKEKFGQLRLYCGGATDEIHNIINKYELLSERICYYCGKPEVPMIDTGWVLPQCFDCYAKLYFRRVNWHNKTYPDKPVAPLSMDEIREDYEKYIADCSDEDGNYSLPRSRKVTRYSEGNKEIIEYDISETADLIIKNWEKKYGKKIQYPA